MTEMRLVAEKRNDGTSWLRAASPCRLGGRVYVAQGLYGNDVLERIAHRYNNFDAVLEALKIAEGVVAWALDNGADAATVAVHSAIRQTVARAKEIR